MTVIYLQNYYRMFYILNIIVIQGNTFCAISHVTIEKPKIESPGIKFGAFFCQNDREKPLWKTCWESYT